MVDEQIRGNGQEIVLATSPVFAAFDNEQKIRTLAGLPLRAIAQVRLK